MKINNLFLLILLSCTVIQANPNLPTSVSQKTFWEKHDPETTDRATTLIKLICVVSPLHLLELWVTAKKIDAIPLMSAAISCGLGAAAHWYGEKVHSAHPLYRLNNQIDRLEKEIAASSETLEGKKAQRQALLANNGDH